MIGIINYGAGNTKSIINAIERLDTPYFISDKAEELSNADKLILPGVGHAKAAMAMLEQQELADFIRSWNKPLLGVCLGMQLLCEFTEEGNTKCLGIIEDRVKKFRDESLKVPKMGWNTMNPSSCKLMQHISQEDYFYFVHSYYLPTTEYSIAQANYGIEYTAAIQKDNFYGVQFHPEKSSKAGSTLLQNFVNL